MDQTTFLLALTRFMSAIARLCLGPLLPLLALSLDFPEDSKAALLSAYSSGYILTQIGGGFLADRYGFGVILSAVAAISSAILTFLGLAATTVSAWTQAYFCLGLVAGPLFPAGSAAIAANVEPSKRAASAAIVDAAATAGTTVASLTPLIASQIFRGHWNVVFQLTAVGLTIVAVTVATSFPSGSKKNATKNDESNGTTESKQEDSSSILTVLLHPVHILTYICHSVDNFSKYSINSWAATMLVAQHHASPTVVGTILGLQEGVGVISKVLVGILLGSSTNLRGVASAVGFAIQGIGLWLAFGAVTAETAGLFLLLSAVAVGSHSIGFRPIYVEGAHAGAVSGFGNTIASFASVMGPLTIGTAVREDGSKDWPMVAMWMLTVNLIGSAAAMGITAMGKAQPEPVHVKSK